MKYNIKSSHIFLIKLSLLSLMLSIIGIFFIDKQLAIFIHNNGIDNITELRLLSEYTPIFILIMLFLNVIMLYRNNKFTLITNAIYLYLCLELALFCKTSLKIIFGRYWPKTWIKHNLSLIHDNVYGFDWLHGFANQGSFPSGHSTYIAYCVTWLYFINHNLRYLWVSIGALGISTQILLDYHFFGDCCAGISLGIIVALFSCIIWHKYLEHNLDKIKI